MAAVQFTGQRYVPEEMLRDTVLLKPGAAYTRSQLEADRRAVLGLGYFRSVAAAQQTENGRTEVTFRLVEWPRVSHIRILGNTVVDRRSVHDVLSTRLGQVLCTPQLQNDIRAIEHLYRSRGYVARVAESLVDEATRSGILRFEILEIRIDAVQVEGGTAELREQCRRRLAERPPALYRPEAVALDQQRLLGVRGVQSALARVETTAPGRVRILWRINEPAPAPARAPS